MKILTSIVIAIDRIDLWDGNPNVMTDTKMSWLTEDIEQGFDEPIGVIPRDIDEYRVGHENYLADLEKRFTVFSGNHRLKAARALGWDTIPCVVNDMERAEAAVHVVRRNALRGDFDQSKFSEFVDRELEDLDPALAAKRLGMMEAEFLKLAKRVLEGDDAELPDSGEYDPDDGAGGEVDTVSALQEMLAAIVEKHGQTIDLDFIAFGWKGHVHMLANMDAESKKAVIALTSLLEEDGENINAALPAMINWYLKQQE